MSTHWDLNVFIFSLIFANWPIVLNQIGRVDNTGTLYTHIRRVRPAAMKKQFLPLTVSRHLVDVKRGEEKYRRS